MVSENKISHLIAPSHSCLYIVFSILIAQMAYIFVITGGSFKALVIAQGIFIIGTNLIFIFKIHELNFSIYNLSVWFILGIIIFLNIIINIGNYSEINDEYRFAAAHMGAILGAAFVVQWAAENLEIKVLLEVLAWTVAPLIFYAFILGAYILIEKDRFFPLGIHPNWWGELAFGFVVCSLALRKKSIKIIFITFGIFLMYLVQSRGALLAAIMTIVVQYFFNLRPFDKSSITRMIFTCLIIFLITVICFFVGWLMPIIVFLEENILFLKDPLRGLGTGLTNRLEGWIHAKEIFYENPIFGQGIDTLGDVHNGFLRMAAEGGIIFIGVIVILIVSSMIDAWKKRNDIIFSILFGIIAYFFTYPRMLNLNIAGIIFLITLFKWKQSMAFEKSKYDKAKKEDENKIIKNLQ
ncbi:hypothetical protein D3OALGB2SA_885 [Olavius algarvensis associated proteobacterium Delta 3]|nr:hypothetical protein D3OALGB2SA_885 [Olavius algarvensis associated proteobacterium Delta 3]